MAAVPEAGTSDCLPPKCRGGRFSLAIGRMAEEGTPMAVTPLHPRRQSRPPASEAGSRQPGGNEGLTLIRAAMADVARKEV